MELKALIKTDSFWAATVRSFVACLKQKIDFFKKILTEKVPFWNFFSKYEINFSCWWLHLTFYKCLQDVAYLQLQI